MKPNGFTIVELIFVIILLGILSAVALPRFFASTSFTNSFNRSDLENALSWARNRAITTQCAHEVRFTPSGWTVFKDTTCGSILPEPGCSGSVVYDFTNTADAVNAQALTGESPTTSAANLRFIFTETGQIFEPTNLPTISACTTLTSAPVASNSSFPLTSGALVMDGETAYVDIE